MDTDRRNFLKKSCMAGGCLCSFSLLAGQQVQASPAGDDGQKKLMQEWISTLMDSLRENTDDDLLRTIMKRCARSHYDQLKMEEMLQPYVGNTQKFIRFLEENWNWKVNFDEESNMVLADENKNFCVCPMVNHHQEVNTGVLCYCSEGFAELMFSKVAGHQVEARVVSSILRGNDRCKYQIKLELK